MLLVTHNQSSTGESKEVSCQLGGASRSMESWLLQTYKSDAGNCICTASSAGVFNVESVTALAINDKRGEIL